KGHHLSLTSTSQLSPTSSPGYHRKSQAYLNINEPPHPSPSPHTTIPFHPLKLTPLKPRRTTRQKHEHRPQQAQRPAHQNRPRPHRVVRIRARSIIRHVRV